MIGKEIHDFAFNGPLTEVLQVHKKTLEKIAKHLPDMRIKSISSRQRFSTGSLKEWNVNEAYTETGEKICTFSENNHI